MKENPLEMTKKFMTKSKVQALFDQLEYFLISNTTEIAIVNLVLKSVILTTLKIFIVPPMGSCLSSGIIRMPQLYANFVEEQYMSVFAIALPYTNPFK